LEGPRLTCWASTWPGGLGSPQMASYWAAQTRLPLDSFTPFEPLHTVQARLATATADLTLLSHDYYYLEATGPTLEAAETFARRHFEDRPGALAWAEQDRQAYAAGRDEAMTRALDAVGKVAVSVAAVSSYGASPNPPAMLACRLPTLTRTHRPSQALRARSDLAARAAHRRRRRGPAGCDLGCAGRPQRPTSRHCRPRGRDPDRL